jgi:TonB-linked SusC/RagA family outer membrane protein
MNKNDHIKVKPHESIFGFLLISLFLLSTNLFAINSGDFKNFTQEENKTISNKISVKKAFTLISKKTSYHFFYNNELKGLETKVRFKNKADIKDTLNSLLKNTDLEYKIDGNEILIRERQTISKNNTKTNKKPKKTIQSNIISGLVFDDYNMPLPGVNVQVVGKATGATTDFDGKFTLAANPEDSLEFSYMGFKNQTIKVGQKTTFNIVMQASSNTLDEVIIAGVAAGTSKKKMSVSVAKIKSEDLNMVPQSSVSASLSGKLAGVTVTSMNGSPGSSSNIILRGATSLSRSQSPLILVDGVIMRGSLSDINVDDVETIEVVKGAAASALYGSEAGNGVIVITSKRGKKLKQDKISITYRGRYEMQQIAKYLDLSQSHAFELNPNWLNATTYTMYNGITYPEGYISGWDPTILGERSEFKYDHYMDLPYRVNNDLQDAMFTNGLSHTHFVGAGYKTDKTNLYLSIEDSKQKGILIETNGYKRNSLRANIDHNITDKLKISASNSFINTLSDGYGGQSTFRSVLQLEPDVDLFRNNENGQKYYYAPSHWSYNTFNYNPLYSLATRIRDTKKLRFLGNYKLKYTINDNLNAEASYAVESENYKYTYETPKGTYISLNPTDNSFNESYGYNEKKQYEAFNQYVKATLNYSKSWNELDFKGKLSYLYEDRHFDKEYNEYTQNSDDLTDVEHVFSDYLTDIRSINYFAIGSVVYRDRYIFDALFRYDGSSLFGANERWHPYYRLSGAYRVTKDLPIEGVEELKIRAAYGISGQRPSFGDKYETYIKQADGSYIPGRLGNKNLKPAKSKEIEIGMDLYFLNRFSIEATYSNTNTIDQLIRYDLPAAAGGFTDRVGNVGSLNTKTFEAVFQAKIIKQKALNWNLGITFDQTTSIITGLDVPTFSTGPDSIFKIENGGEFGTMYGYSLVSTLEQMAAQLPIGDTIDEYSVNSDGVVVKTSDIGTIDEKAFPVLNEDGSEKDDMVIGKTAPKFRMGLNTNISYKNFSFYMLWKWKNGGQIYNRTAQRLIQSYRHEMMDQRFTAPENKKTTDYYQSLYNLDHRTDFWVEDASYVKLNEASIYYNYKPKKHLDNIKFGITGKNLYTFTDYSGYDPEAGSNGFIYDNFGYPNFRSFAASLELKF